MSALFDPPEAECPRCMVGRVSWNGPLLGRMAAVLSRWASRLVPRLWTVKVKCEGCGLRFDDVEMAPRRVIGYHGCKRAFAERLVAGDVKSWDPSRNDYDWLGEGIYFWEDAPERAWAWARQRYKDEAAVVAAEIRLGRCLDLADIAFADLLRESFDDIVETYRSEARRLPKNEGKEQKLRRLDRTVIDRLTKRTDGQGGVHYQTVRAPFEEGDPVYPGAMLRTLSHIQIAVRDHRCIGPRIHRVQPGGGQP